MKELIVIVTALLAAYLYRETEFKKFMLQKKIELFSVFLTTAKICEGDAMWSIIAVKLDKKEKDVMELSKTINDILSPLRLNLYNAKLLLNNSHRLILETSFEQIKSLIIVSYTEKSTKISEIQSEFNKIENMFIDSLNETKKITPISNITKALRELFQKNKNHISNIPETHE